MNSFCSTLQSSERNTAKSAAFWALNSSSSSSAALRHKAAWNCRTLRLGFLRDFQCWYIPTIQSKLEISWNYIPQVISLLIWSHHPRPWEKPWSPNFLLLGKKGVTVTHPSKPLAKASGRFYFTPSTNHPRWAFSERPLPALLAHSESSSSVRPGVNPKREVAGVH